MLLLGLMLGCPEPPSSTSGGGGPAGTTAGGPGGAGGAGGGNQGAGGGGGEAGAGGGGGGGGGALFDGELQEEQDAIVDGVTVSGTITCDEGGGPFRILLFPPPPSGGPPPADEPPRPFTGITTDAGDWTMKGPKGESVVIMGFDDEDGDGAPGGPIFFAELGKDVTLDADVEGVALDCGDVISGPPPGSQDAGLGEAGGEMPTEGDGPPENAMKPVEGGGELGPPGGPPDGAELPPPDGAEGPPPGEGEPPPE